MSAEPALSEAARERTVATLEENRAAWEGRPVVRRLYGEWFELLASRLSRVDGETVELGSGFGALRETIPGLVTTDVVASPWADRVADAEHIPFADGSLANLALVDVLHHVPHPRACFEEAERVLAPGGRMVMVEPYCAPLSAFAYSRLHEEDLDLDADPEQPQRPGTGDPFDANIALPTILFWRRPGTVERWAPGLRVVERLPPRLARLPALGRVLATLARAAAAARPGARPRAAARPGVRPARGVPLPRRRRADLMERARGIGRSAWGLVMRALGGPRWKWALALAVVALIARVPFIIGDFATGITPDAPTYLQIAEGLPGSADTNAYRTLGYGLFVAPFTLIPWDVSADVYGTVYEFPAALILVQHLIGIGLVAAVFWVTDRYFGRWPAIFAALITALAPPMAMVEHFMLPDFLFGVLVFAGAVALIEAVLPEKPSVRGLVLAGVVFGVATNVKPTAQVLIVVAPLVLAFATRSWRETWRGALVVGGVMVVVMLPWIVHNGIRYDQWTMSVQGGQALWLRVFDQDKLPIPTDSAEGRRANELYHEYLEDPPPEYAQNPEALAETESYSYVFNELGQEMSHVRRDRDPARPRDPGDPRPSEDLRARDRGERQGLRQAERGAARLRLRQGGGAGPARRGRERAHAKARDRRLEDRRRADQGGVHRIAGPARRSSCSSSSGHGGRGSRPSASWSRGRRSPWRDRSPPRCCRATRRRSPHCSGSSRRPRRSWS